MVCDEEIRFPAAGAEAVCASTHCRMLLARRTNISPEAFRFQDALHRRQRRELRERTETERLRRAEQSAREAREHEAVRQANGLDDDFPATRYPLVVLPSGPRGLEPLSQQRRRKYREHLEAIVTEAVSGAGDDASTARDTSTATDPVPLAAQLCTQCRGGCCSIGGDKAFLNAATIRRFLLLRPDLQPGQVAAEYLGRLEDQAIGNSCINHTSTGCALPTEMRSDTCNDFFCGSLRAWQTRHASSERPLGAFVIQRRQDHWSKDRPDVANDVVGIAVVTEEGSRPLAQPKEGTSPGECASAEPSPKRDLYAYVASAFTSGNGG